MANLIDTVIRLGDWFPGVDRMDRAYAWTGNQLLYAITDARKDIERIDREGLPDLNLARIR